MNTIKIYLVLLLVLLTSCTVNLSKRDPYYQAIGRSFVLQHDFYIYFFNDYGKYSYISFPCKLRLGTTDDLAGTFAYGLSKSVEEQYVGSKNDWVTLEGFLPKGTVVTIKRIVKERDLDGNFFFYIVSPAQGAFVGQDINPSDIVALFNNPPYSKTWSDPPIFDPKAALPLPSDGIWWK